MAVFSRKLRLELDYFRVWLLANTVATENPYSRKVNEILDSIHVIVVDKASAATPQCHGKKMQLSGQLTEKL